jgi:hypothetical protein
VGVQIGLDVSLAKTSVALSTATAECSGRDMHLGRRLGHQQQLTRSPARSNVTMSAGGIGQRITLADVHLELTPLDRVQSCPAQFNSAAHVGTWSEKVGKPIRTLRGRVAMLIGFGLPRTGS